MNADKRGYCMRNLRSFAVRYSSKDQKKIKSLLELWIKGVEVLNDKRGNRGAGFCLQASVINCPDDQMRGKDTV
jgi:hypothetical protein